MKIKVTMKGRAAIYHALIAGLFREAESIGAEAQALLYTRTEAEAEKLGRWLRCGKYITVEFDTELMTATVLDAKEG